jgi:hypothetical protein
MVLTRVLNSDVAYLVARIESEHNISAIFNMELNKVVEMVIGVQQQRVMIICTQVQKDVLSHELRHYAPFIVYCMCQIILLDEGLPRQEGQSINVDVCR